MKKTKRGKKKKVEYTEGPDLNKASFLGRGMPTIENLIQKKETRKITIEIESEVIDYFKTQADRHGEKYQRLIRELLKQFVDSNKKAV